MMQRTLLLLLFLLATSLPLRAEEPQEKIPRVAAVVTEYRHNSHADVIVSRLIQGYNLTGEGEFPKLKLVSLYTDQVPENDTSREFSKKYGFPIYETVEEALTLGTGKLAVDGVLLVAEHGKYPESATGQIEYPKRRLFTEILQVFEKSGKSVPVFCDKHLADNWEDAKWIYDQSQRLKFPMMAGSSLPTLWRYPAVDVKQGAKLKEMVAVSYHRLDAYGFHALEMVQCLAERREGGETGVESVQCLTGEEVWKAGEQGIYDPKLLEACFSRLKERPLKLKEGETVRDRVKEPVLFIINYRDGFRACVLTLNYAVVEWAVAWREENSEEIQSTLFWTQEARPFMHFSFLTQGVEQMIHTGKPTWPVERTLLTSGVLDALLISKKNNGEKLATPWLNIQYQSDWTWKEPPPPPQGRPIQEQ